MQRTGRILFAAALFVAAFPLAAQQVYRYIDATGRVVYSDQPAPANARSVEQKKLVNNVIDTSEPGLETRQAQAKFPVTLYAFDCGKVCDDAKALLKARGIPHTFLDATQPANAEKLKQLTGGTEIPVLLVGTKVVKGLEASLWQTALDQAGYPKIAANAPAAR